MSLRCGKCNSNAVIRDSAYVKDEEGEIGERYDALLCLTCGNSSDSRQYGFKEDDVSKRAPCKNCGRTMSIMQAGMCGSCFPASKQPDAEGALARVRKRWAEEDKAKEAGTAEEEVKIAHVNAMPNGKMEQEPEPPPAQEMRAALTRAATKAPPLPSQKKRPRSREDLDYERRIELAECILEGVRTYIPDKEAAEWCRELAGLIEGAG
jgi:hypothetical protein